MGKKKGSKVETNGEVEEIVTDNATAPPADTGKKGKKKKKNQDWEDDIAKELEDMKLEEMGVKEQPEVAKKTKNDAEVDGDNEPKEKGKKEKTKGKQPEVVEVEEEKDKKGKKGKKAKKKGYDEEEDLDKLLAEIEMEYKGEKPKEEPAAAQPEETGKKGKKKKNEPEPKPEPPKPQVEVTTDKKKRKNKDQKLERSQSQDDAQDETPSEKSKDKDKDESEAQEGGEGGEGGEEGEPETKEVKPEAKKKKEARKPNAKVLAAMKEALAKKKEEEERLQREEEERIRREEERIRQIEEQKRLEQEKKERKKQADREKRERLKQEGKWLTAKQREDQRRAKEMMEHLRAQGINMPMAGEKGEKRAPISLKPQKTKKNKKPQQEEAKPAVEEKMEEEEAKKEDEIKESWDDPAEDEVKEDWDQISDDDEEDTSEATKASQDTDTKKSSEKGDDDDVNNVEELESESEEEPEHQTEAEKRKARTLARIAKRKAESEKKLDPNCLRAPVVCVLGHVDHGKTKILDKLRRTNVQEGEVGGITQQIGATNVPAEAVQRQTHMVKDFNMDSLNFPGLLIIDTPGHESFSNLRSRGSSLCDIAVLVVDITQGLEPQTIESITLLKKRKTPFVVALNKVDRVFDWVSQPAKDIREIIKLQNSAAKNDFDRRTQEVIGALNMQGLNAALFWENPDPRVYVSLVPTSAISGDGMGNLISMICNLCQKRLSKRLVFSEELQCTVLEVKTIQGHGTTIDVILINGRLREGDTVVLAGTEGPIVTQIRSLLLPKPLKEIRVKGQYDEFKEIQAAQGVKIAARELEKAIAGLNLQVCYHEDEIDLIKEAVDREFKNAMRSIKVKERGVYVQASTLGALEALLEFFKTNEVPYSGIRVGPVVKRDVMKAAAMLEHDPMYAVILAFDVKVEKDAQDLADKEGVKIFSEETIYHLGDRYVDYLKDYKKKKQDEFKHIAVFPSRLKIIPTAIFNKRDPIVIGVSVETGVLRTGTPLCVPSKEFVEIGIVTSMEFDHKNVDLAKKGVDVCIKIDPVPGHTPKLFGRHFDQEDILVSKISRESINACKDYFRDDLSKTDWKLMAELKKEFQIL